MPRGWRVCPLGSCTALGPCHGHGEVIEYTWNVRDLDVGGSKEAREALGLVLVLGLL